jgi:cobaltochelatase CobT
MRGIQLNKEDLVSKPESPSEPFKRAVAVAVRSLAGEPELEVNFSSEPPALKG